MASKKILLVLESDRNIHPLLDFLSSNAKVFGWKLKVGQLGTSFDPGAERSDINIEYVSFSKYQECDQAIKKTDLVIAVASDALLLQIADSCISHRKSLVSPGKLTRQLALKKAQAKDSGVLILMDCGVSPGLDHIIAKKAIDNIHSKGGKITAFESYSGTFVAETSEPNPLQMKLTESAPEMLSWGRHNNRHLAQGRLQHIPWFRLYERAVPVKIQGDESFVAIPEGDSLYYRKIYNLNEAHTVVKGKLLRKDTARIWNVLVKLGLTDSSLKIDMAGERSAEDILESLLPYSPTDSLEQRLMDYTGAEASDIDKLRWLGLLNADTPVANLQEATPASILQMFMETKLQLDPEDKDCVVMEYRLSYELREESNELTATLILRGENSTDSAMARLLGYTCGAAVKCVLLGSIKSKGLHIPVTREIYDPILNELEEMNIAFNVTEQRAQNAIVS
jgi:saccharopine dehydrogenase (NADP+, L-glutamate forming)